MNTDRRAILTGAATGLVAIPAIAVAQHRNAASTAAIPTGNGANVAGDWLEQILAHHRVLEKAFAASKDARGPAARSAAEMHLVTVVAAHAGAEETAVYPTMVAVGMNPDGHQAYNEQVEVKIGFGELGAIPDKTSADYDAKLEMLRAAVADHMRHEEDQWYPELKRRANATQNAAMTMHYRMDYARYL